MSLHVVIEVVTCVFAFCIHTYYLGLIMRNPVFGVSGQVRLKPACSATETSNNIENLHGASFTSVFPR